ncbi:MAG: FAD-dependent oxidoreductase [Spirochaetales bacterium]
MKTDFDTIIIGFGKAGKTIAGKLAMKGEKVALIEKDSAMYGGTCINVGCIPSKRLITDACACVPAGGFEEEAAYYKTAIEQKRQLTGALREANYNKLINAGVKIIDGEASFKDKNAVEVHFADGSVSTLTASKFVINTGSRPVSPAIKGLEGNPKVFFSETIMNSDTLPGRLSIIGGGYIGLEFACMYANFGSSVTIIQDGPVFLPREDEDIALSIREMLDSKGVAVITGAEITEFDGGTVLFTRDGEERSVDSDAILVATGRRANTDTLNAENAGIKLTERKAVDTDEHLRTNISNIWAAGDVRGKFQFTYISLDDSRIILSDMSGNGFRTTENRGAFSYSVFIDPPFSKVGLGEKEVQVKGLDFKVMKMNTAEIPKAKVIRKPIGMLKALVDPGTEHILGAALFCPESHELINMIKLAMDNGLKYTVLRDFIYTHPTMAEGLNDLFAL